MSTLDVPTAPVPMSQPAQVGRRSRARKLDPCASPGRLAAVAEAADDPCDVALDAMPGFVVGDLTPPDSRWLLAHTSGCNYCARMLDRYERIDDLLDDLDHAIADGAPPPPPVLGRRRASYGRIDSPLGPLYVAVSDQGVCEVDFAVNHTEADFRRRLADRGFWAAHDEGAVAPVAEELREYFSGKRNRFEVPLDFAGVSPFTRSVLSATAEVPFGQLRTYRDIAERLGRPRATRAVGNALGRNPIPVIVPCHRIIRSDATLGGYTGGIEIKQRLLSHEGIARFAR